MDDTDGEIERLKQIRVDLWLKLAALVKETPGVLARQKHTDRVARASRVVQQR